MTGAIEVLILADNTAAAPGITTEHGLSMWVSVDGKHILFDTGMGVALPENVAALGVDLRQTDCIALSHGHFDHTGGLPYVFGMAASPRIFLHPDALGMRYGCLQTPPHKPIGMRPDIAESLIARTEDIIFTTCPMQISDHAWITGPVPRRTAFEDTGGPFFVDEACQIKDAIADDQAIWLETAEGIVLLLGCAHSGVVNTIEYVSALTHGSPVHAIIGGMHLLNASGERLEATVRALKQFRVERIAPCHCTGDNVLPFLLEQFPKQCVQAGAGSHFAWSVRNGW